MEAVFVIIGLVAVYFAYMFVRFAMFKSKLMHEFGKHGVSYIAADLFFANYSGEINGLYNDGVSVQ